MNQLTHPVVFFVYKRPGSTLQFLELIKESGIKKIYIYGDGPKKSSDLELVEQVKNIVLTFKADNKEIEIIEHFSGQNLGLKNNIIGGLNLTFKTENSLIVLEDDCLPTPDFFRFTSELLDKYRSNPTIMSINGTSVGLSNSCSYDFSRYAHCWGWATWKRAWELYDPNVNSLDDHNWTKLSSQLWDSWIMRSYWKMMLQMTHANWIDTWDYQWSFAHFLNHGLSIYPSANLISNIGFDSVATNTKTRSPIALLPTQAIKWPLIHPDEVKENLALSKLVEAKFYKNPIAILGMLRQYVYWLLSANK